MIEEIFSRISKSTFSANGDATDKLVSFYTMLIYIIGAIFLSLSPFVAGFFECMTPAQWKGGWTNYATRYCYLKNTYYVPFEESLSELVKSGDAFEVTYYQWVPYYLAVSSVFFMLPYVYWTSVTKVAGIDLEFLVTEASKFDVDSSKEKREGTTKALAEYIDKYLDNQEDVPGKKSFFEKLFDSLKCCSNHKGTLMGNSYFFSKILYILVISLQLVSLCKFLGMNLIVYSFQPETMSQLLLRHSFDWREQELFPLVTFCNFTKQILHGNHEKQFIQCSMPNNIFNERFFVILCYWLLAILALQILATISWFNSIFLSFRREKYVKSLIRVTQSDDILGSQGHLDPSKLRGFVSWYLQPDGIFVFQMIKKNTSPVVASEIMFSLWERFNANYDEEMKHRRKKSKDPKDREDQESNMSGFSKA